MAFKKRPDPNTSGRALHVTHVSPTKKGGWQAPLSLRPKDTPAGVVFANLSEFPVLQTPPKT